MQRDGARLRCFAGGDTGLRALDVAEFERVDLTSAEQGLNVGFDPAAVHRQGGRLDRPSTSAKSTARFGLNRDVPVAYFSDSQQSGSLRFRGDRVEALADGDEFLVGELARLLDGHQTIAPVDGSPVLCPSGLCDTG